MADGLCPICRSGFSDANADPWSALECGHLIHDYCYQGMVDASPGVARAALKCPTCRTSADDMAPATAALEHALPPLRVDNNNILE